MSFARPDFRPGEVRRAGEVLANPLSSEADLSAAAKVLSRWRAVHLYPMNTFQATLRDRLRGIDSAAIVGQRLKRAPSVIAKLRSRPTMRLQQMQDIAGLRAIVGNMSKLRRLQQRYEGGRLTHILQSKDDYVEAPKPDGYRSVHLVYKYCNPNAEEYDNLHVELQLRTKLQHAWATAVETVDIYTGETIKAGNPSPAWSEFFKLASAAFTSQEATSMLPEFASTRTDELIEMLRAAERRMNVLVRLRGFRVATNEIITRSQERPSFLHLVVLNTQTRRLTITSFSETEQEAATEAYSAAEKLRRDGDPVDPVLVKGGNVRQLKKSYPNYFADTDEFARRIERVLGITKP